MRCLPDSLRDVERDLFMSGGARLNSGPAADPLSARSEARGLQFSALPNEGYQGEIPDFPKPVQDQRVLDLWNEAWRTPQAAAWALESWRWPVIAEYCNIAFLVEVEASAALIAQLHRYRDQLGLTPAGMSSNGWAIAQPQISKTATTANDATDEPRERKGRPERRMRAV